MSASSAETASSAALSSASLDGREGAISIVSSLSSRRIAVTGSTGFLGTALVERLLRVIPECNLVLLVRSGKRTPAAERVRREILRNDCFDRLRRELGDDPVTGFEATIARRVTVIDGDVSRDGLGLDDTGRAAATSARQSASVASGVSVRRASRAAPRRLPAT